MAHPLYGHAMRFVGRPVHAYHVSGTVYSGVLHSVNPAGVHLLHCRAMPYLADFQKTKADAMALSLHVQKTDEASTTLVYAPGAFFAFGALTGLTLGALAAAPYYW